VNTKCSGTQGAVCCGKTDKEKMQNLMFSGSLMKKQQSDCELLLLKERYMRLTRDQVQLHVLFPQTTTYQSRKVVQKVCAGFARGGVGGDKRKAIIVKNEHSYSHNIT
jgi:hypothetical protein